MLFREIKMKILTASATIALLICHSSSAASSIEELLKPFAKSSVTNMSPQGLPVCTPEDLQQLEGTLNVKVPIELKAYFLNFSDKWFSGFEIFLPQSKFQNHPTQGIITLVTQAWKLGVPREYLPFCYDNANYYCIHLETGAVRFWSSHEQAFSDHPKNQWISFNDWVVKAWIELMRK